MNIYRFINAQTTGLYLHRAFLFKSDEALHMYAKANTCIQIRGRFVVLKMFVKYFVV